ncbi:MAG: DUF2064 domain-containing protein [Bacteroidota bacterium]
MKTNTALLIFARSASEESKYKRFKGSQLFFEIQNQRVKKIAKQLPIDFYWIDEHQQVGKHFGEKFCHAIQHIFSQGHKNIICIGNDSPQLKISNLKKAIDCVEANQAVIGPSANGGFYLLGLQKEVFDFNVFLNFNWNANNTYSEVYSYLKQKNSVEKLQVYTDVNSAADLSLIKQKTFQLYAALKDFITQLNRIKIQPPFYLIFKTSKKHFANINKAPPVFS